jgi:hypothetical protein
MAKKNLVEEPKFVVKKRDKRTQQAFENLTPFRHPLADIFDSPINSEESNPNDLNPTSPTSPSTRTSRTSTDNSNKSGIINDVENLAAPAIHPVAPVRDFQKVPNSVTRQAIPSGFFKSGKCKQLYDALYSLTRGAIKPQRTVRINKPRLMKMAGIGTRQTLWQNLKHLEDVGLVETNVLLGEHGGNEYTVFLPDELQSRYSPTSPDMPTSPTSPTSPTNMDYSYYSVQKVVPLVGIESSPTSPSSKPINIESNETPKTLFKTEEKKFDDEPQAAGSSMIEKINEAFKNFTGREISKSDDQKLAQIGELIAAEFVEAASRTKVVSDPVAFLLTHLRRRLGVRTIKVETSSDKETGKGTTSAKPIKREIQLTDDEIQECPDCQGRLLIYPAGPSKGAVMCKHSELVKAKQAEEQKAEEGKVIK